MIRALWVGEWFTSQHTKDHLTNLFPLSFNLSLSLSSPIYAFKKICEKSYVHPYTKMTVKLLSRKRFFYYFNFLIQKPKSLKRFTPTLYFQL